MAKIEKKIPQLLEDNSKYIIRTRSINNLGVASDWSKSVIANTEATASVVGGRLVITDDSIYGYDGNGKLAFGYFGQGISRVNLAKNPSFETNLTGYTANAFTSLMSDSTPSEGYFGQDSMVVHADSAASGIGFSQAAAHRFDVTEDELYTASLYIKNPSDQANVRISLGFEFFDASTDSLGIAWAPQSTLVMADGEWFRVALIGITAPESAVKAALHFKTNTAMPLDNYFYVDAILIEETSILKEYFDGSITPGKTEWTGTAHASDSAIVTNIGDVFIGGTLTIEGYVTDDDLGDYVTYPDLGGYIPVGGSAADIVTNNTTITGGNISTGSIQSEFYTDGPVYSLLGMRISLDGNGYIKTTQFSLEPDGDAFFSGTLNAAGGTFAGALSAATGSFAGSLSAATGSFAGSLSAATGSFAGTLDVGGADATSFHVDASGNMWLGAATYASAPFRVSSAGAVTATSGTFSGSITGATGTFSGALDIGGADTTSFHVSTGGNMWLGAGTYASAPFKVSSTGVLEVGDASKSIIMDASGSSGTITFSGGFGALLGIECSANFDLISVEDISMTSQNDNITMWAFDNVSITSFSGSISITAGTNGSLDLEGGNFNGVNISDGGVGGVNIDVGSSELNILNGPIIMNDETIYFRGGGVTGHSIMYDDLPVDGFARVGTWIRGSQNVVLGISSNGATCFFASNGNMYLPPAGLYTNHSSIEKKHAIETISREDALDEVAQWRPVTFVYNDDELNRIQDGFIAEEMYPVTPNMVIGMDDDDHPVVMDYGKATPRLAGAIQALLYRIEKQDARIAALEAAKF